MARSWSSGGGGARTVKARATKELVRAVGGVYDRSPSKLKTRVRTSISGA